MVDYSTNPRAAELMGCRPEGVVPFDQPCELGFHCPVCKYDLVVDGNFDERLLWSEYEAFIWCSVCNKDYPSALCHPDVDEAIEIFLNSVAGALAKRVTR